jgi:hypothetical protein
MLDPNRLRIDVLRTQWTYFTTLRRFASPRVAASWQRHSVRRGASRKRVAEIVSNKLRYPSPPRPVPCIHHVGPRCRCGFWVGPAQNACVPCGPGKPGSAFGSAYSRCHSLEARRACPCRVLKYVASVSETLFQHQLPLRNPNFAVLYPSSTQGCSKRSPSMTTIRSIPGARTSGSPCIVAKEAPSAKTRKSQSDSGRSEPLARDPKSQIEDIAGYRFVRNMMYRNGGGTPVMASSYSAQTGGLFRVLRQAPKHIFDVVNDVGLQSAPIVSFGCHCPKAHKSNAVI